MIVFSRHQPPQTGMMLIDQYPYSWIAGHIGRIKLFRLAPVFLNSGDHGQVKA